MSVIQPRSLFNAVYPSFFPCPTWEFGHTITGHLRRRRFECGWTRQRKRWPEQGAVVPLNFVMPTTMYDNWHRWMVNNGYRWFAVPLDRFAGERVVYEVRLRSKMSLRYGQFDKVVVNVMAELGAPLNAELPPGGDDTTISPRTGLSVGDEPLKEELPQYGPQEDRLPEECLPYACDAIRQYLIDNYPNVWSAESATGGILDRIQGTVDLNIDLGASSYFDSDPVIADACYTCWRRVPIGGGGSGQGIYRDLGSAAAASDAEDSISATARFTGTIGATLDHEFMQREFNLRRVSDDLILAASVKVGVSHLGGPILRLSIGGYDDQVLGSTYTNVDVPWTSLDTDATDPNKFQLDVSRTLTGGPGAWFLNTTATLSVNGDQVAQAVRTGASMGFAFDIKLSDDYIELFGGDDVNAYINNVGFSETIIDTDGSDAAYLRNLAGYTPPGWCPV